jgi:c-di-GMP-binding flagellar brake protein YcgR
VWQRQHAVVVGTRSSRMRYSVTSAMPEPTKNPRQFPDDTSHVTGVLFRSHIEIKRILQQLLDDGSVLAAELGDPGQLFLTRLLHIDADGEFLVVGYSHERQANTRLLEHAHTVFQASSKRGRVEIPMSAPTETVFEGEPAVRFAFPQTLVQSQRREHPRFTVPPDVSLRCIADTSGVAPFEARIVDVSRGGMGDLTYDLAITLATGTVLRDCKIMLAGSDPIVADLEVRYTISIVQPDGSLARRSGVKFLGDPKGWHTLLGRFIVELGEG